MADSSQQISENTQKFVKNLGALCNITRRIAIEAGEVLLNYYDQVEFLCIETKDDNSPVSKADRDAEELIIKRLAEHVPDIPVIGEESKHNGENPVIDAEGYFWLVDPLDGTSAFLKGNDDFTVNIALIHKRKPILGVVYAPAFGVLYAGYENGPAIKWNDETPDQDKTITARPCPKKGLTAITSYSHTNMKNAQKFLEGFKVNKMLRRASSIKMCLIAEGKADIYPRLGLTCEWDTAAAHAVLNSAGGCITNMEGTELTYGYPDKDFLNPEFVASSENWFTNETS